MNEQEQANELAATLQRISEAVLKVKDEAKSQWAEGVAMGVVSTTMESVAFDTAAALSAIFRSVFIDLRRVAHSDDEAESILTFAIRHASGNVSALYESGGLDGKVEESAMAILKEAVKEGN